MFHMNQKKRRLFSAIIIAILVLAMLVPLLEYIV